MAIVSVKNAEQLLKTVYLDVVSNQLNTGVSPFLTEVEKSSAEVVGSEVKVLAPYGLSGGVGAIAEDSDLPASSGRQYVTFAGKLKNLVGNVEISDKLLKQSHASAGAFVNALNLEMEGLLESSRVNMSRMLFGDGTGVIGTITAAGTAQATWNIGAGNTKKLQIGQTVDILSTTGTNLVIGGRVAALDHAAGTVTLAAAFSVLSTNLPATVYMARTRAGDEITGLGAVFSDTATLYGVDRAVYPGLWPTKVALANNDNDLTDARIQNVIDDIERRTGHTPDFLICSPGVRRAYMEYLQAFKRNTDVLNLTGGFKAISFNGIPLVADRFCPAGTLYLLNTKDFVLAQMDDWHWFENESGTILRRSYTKTAYAATLIKYCELVCKAPGAQGVITNIAEA
ncbi:MAG: phage major capsid protein [Clostridiales bacterium]|jgi:hypothetical protein|nr:phage major capsid protein [Clostridiales bacterium]